MSDLLIRFGLWLARLGMRHKRYSDETLPYVLWAKEGEETTLEIGVDEDGTLVETEVTTTIHIADRLGDV